jgi:PDZ domain-containing protein
MYGKLLIVLGIFWLAEPKESVTLDSIKAASEDGQQALAADLKALEHTEFRVREAAAQRLAARGIAVVAPLAAMAENGSAEASVRAFELLRQLHRDGDDETYEAVETTYEALVQSDNILAASRAESAIEAVSEVRHRRAVASFRKLGGVVQYASDENPAADAPPPPIRSALINRHWTGGDDGLKYLRRIEDFRSPLPFQSRSALYVIKGAKVSTEALADLKATFPGIVVERGPACLGVKPSRDFGEGGLPIGEVVDGSAADQAGLQQDDIIVEFDNVPTPDFVTLVKRIGEHEPGDKVPVLFSRGGEKKTTTVELGEWK